MLKRHLFPVMAALAAIYILLPVPAMGQSTADLTGTWEGTIDVPNGAQLQVVFHITQADEGWSATWDSPDQGAVGLPAGAPTVAEGVLRIPLPAIQGRFEGTLTENGNAVEGMLHQGPQSMRLDLRRTSSVAVELERPQEPKGPTPYSANEVTYPNDRASGVRLAGTLTIPEGRGPFPAVVLISGSGPQDRNQALAGHKPFLVLADYLTRRGIAVLRFDDRGIGESTGTFGSATSEDFATDVLAGVEFLATRPDVDAARIGLVGHSEGGLIAPMVANQSSDVAFVVLMAGPGLPGDEILLLQSALIAQANGASAAGVELNDQIQRELFAVLKSTDDPQSVREEIRTILEGSVARIGAIDPRAMEAQRQQIGPQVVQLTSPWFHYFVTHDPREPLRQLRQPVLAINGEKDLQVPPKENLGAIEAALKEGGNRSFTVHEFEGLNHLFQTANTGSPTEYADITETLSPRVLAVIAGWVLER